MRSFAAAVGLFSVLPVRGLDDVDRGHARGAMLAFPWLGALDSARDLWRLRARQGIFWCLCGDVFFYTLSTLVMLEINAYGVAQLGLGPTMASLLPGETPAALVEQASLPTQRCITGTLQTLPALAQQHRVRPPALIIIGGVVALQPQLLQGMHAMPAPMD